MQLHERYFLVAAAQVDVNMAVTAVIEKHELTYIELLCILNHLEARWLKAALQAERDEMSGRSGEGE